MFIWLFRVDCGLEQPPFLTILRKEIFSMLARVLNGFFQMLLQGT